MDDECEVCGLLEARERGDDPFGVARVTTGSISLLPTQYYEGYTIFSANRCVPELHDLGDAERDLYLHEMALVAEAVFRAFSPRKLNYELLGNGTPHRGYVAPTRSSSWTTRAGCCCFGRYADRLNVSTSGAGSGLGGVITDPGS